MTDGVLYIDKPAGMTSFGVVARVRRVLSRQSEKEEGKGATRAADSFRARRAEGKSSVVPHKRKRVKVGHTGTLDPFATGLMIIVVGKECRNAGNYSKLDKVYEATMKLGQKSTTGDPEGEITSVSGTRPTLEAVLEAARGLTGQIEQVPPAFSAIKVNGQRAYKLARDGKEAEIPPRKVTVHSLEVLDYQYPEVKIRAHVSSGTYIRTLVEDIGEKLGTGAYCSQLRRTRVADWDVTDAMMLSDIGVEN